MRRVVITGIGTIVSTGIGKDSLLKAITEEPTENLPPEDFEVHSFEPERFLSSPQRGELNRTSQMAVGGARLALEDGSLENREDELKETGLVLGVSFKQGKRENKEDQFDLGSSKWSFLSNRTFQIPSFEVAQACGLQGVHWTIEGGCSSSALAVGQAFDSIRYGKTVRMLAGGAEAKPLEEIVQAFSSWKLLASQKNGERSGIFPFDRRRRGTLLGEGASILLLEEREVALQRGVPIYAEIKGWGIGVDKNHLLDESSDESQFAKVVSSSLREAKVLPEELDYINAHGVGVLHGDRLETRTVKRVLGSHAYRVGVSSIKPRFGYLYSASKALDFACCALALKEGIIPPTFFYQERDPECDLDYVPGRFRKGRLERVLSLGYGMGGLSSAFVFQRHDKDR